MFMNNVLFLFANGDDPELATDLLTGYADCMRDEVKRLLALHIQKKEYYSKIDEELDTIKRGSRSGNTPPSKKRVLLSVCSRVRDLVGQVCTEEEEPYARGSITSLSKKRKVN